ncbi:hypothetical protein M378DRAFT_423730 [Amanita muscaria Koide BX008]|uniref:Uncharacterized protein n=1 Tax=Amanita muscaria (strain Koide BX008) TaxID=946122 RepID=A0A0C2WJU2_AMAMK|nr:hypothetical protein M378DRAFT_423730 [Amanita muscaria Koide BX008]
MLVLSAILLAAINPSSMVHSHDISTPFSPSMVHMIMPQFKSVALQGTQESKESIGIVAVLVVEVDRHPVFFMDVKPPISFLYDSKREEADEQMRRRFRDLRQLLAIPVLYGISAFGTRLSFYEYDPATHVLQPEQVLRSHPSILADVAPITRWDCDVLQQEGANRLRKVVNQVKEMCAKV